jgi:YD repeat-containing protein
LLDQGFTAITPSPCHPLTRSPCHLPGFVGGSASSVFAHGGALVNTGQPDPAMYAYTNIAHVHAVTAISGLGTFAYDDNGNMTQRVEGGTTYKQTFDVENRLTQVVAVGVQTTTYVYDADGGLLKRVKSNGSTIVYVGPVEYEFVGGGGLAFVTSYYNLPGARGADPFGY